MQLVATAFLLLLAYFVLAGQACTGAPLSEQGSETLVRGLALVKADINHDLEALQLDPSRSCALLVAELHAIPRKTYYPEHKNAEERHVIACLRALRYLTGMTFTANSSARLSDDEIQFLDFNIHMHDLNPGHKIHFFAVWMSRDADFVAPEDTQKKIIEQWQKWSLQKRVDFQFRKFHKPEAEMENWYWYG